MKFEMNHVFLTVLTREAFPDVYTIEPFWHQGHKPCTDVGTKITSLANGVSELQCRSGSLVTVPMPPHTA